MFRGGVGVRTESLLDAFLVIILSTTGLTAFEKSLKHNLLRACQEEHERRATDLQCAPISVELSKAKREN